MDLTDAYATYQDHQLQYDYIEDRLRSINEMIHDADERTRRTLLWLADTYALITSNTDVEAHDLAFAGLIRNPFDAEHVQDVLETTRGRASGNHAVMYYNNKARFIRENLGNGEYARQSKLFNEGRFDELHELKIDAVKGLRATKAAFSLAMCGVLQKACLDSNMVRACNVDVDLQHVDVEEYDDLVAQAQQLTPRLAEQVPPFIWQWVVWDTVRESAVTTHDAWFLGIEAHSTMETPFPTTQTHA